MSKLNRQHGAVVIMTAGFMMLAVLFLALVVDTGRLYMEKRNLQRVADVVALELASIGWCADGAPSEDATTALNRNRSSGSGIAFKVTPECGTVSEGNLRVFTPVVVPQDGQAVRVVIINTVAKSLVAGGYFSSDPNVTLEARAVAGRGGDPLARLTIRSKVANLNPAGANPVLGAVLGGILGIDNLSLINFQGLAQTQVNLLGLISTGELSVGSFTELLSAENVSLLNLIDASIDVVGQGSSAGLSLTALKSAAVGVDLGAINVNLVDLLGLSVGAPDSAADVSINLFDLISGSILLASKNDPNSVATIDLPNINVPGVANAIVKVKVIEAPRLSAAGNPEEINGGSVVGMGYNPANDPSAIYVRTAQVRVFASINIPALTAISDLVDLTSLVGGPVLGGITSFLQGQLGLGGLVSNIIGSIVCPVLILAPNCPTYNTAAISLLPDARIDISLDVGGGEAYISDFDCSSDKQLTVPITTRAANLRVGKLGSTVDQAVANAFASTSPPTVSSPIELLVLGSTWAKPDFCLISVLCTGIKYNSSSSCAGTDGAPCNYNQTQKKNGYVRPATAVTLTIDSGVLASAAADEHEFPVVGRALPEVDDVLVDADYQSVVAGAVVNSLSNTVSGIGLKIQNFSGGVLGAVLGLVSGLVANLQTVLEDVIESILSPVLDPLVTSLLEQLGLSLAETQVAGQLSCNSNEGVRLFN